MHEALKHAVTSFSPIPEGVHRPLWSVMVPTYNSSRFLRQTLQSVLDQAPGPDQMEIEVVDNCSTVDDPEPVVNGTCGGRVAFYRRPANGGAVDNFNECIRRSHGQLIHILHSDDYVMPGFYTEIESLAEAHPDTALLATRCFVVDEAGIIQDLTRRIPELEQSCRSARPFYYDCPVQFPGAVIRRAFYEAHGGFLLDLVHAADREMWARAVSTGGGVISPHVLACYRVSASNETAGVKRSGENVRDLLRLSEIFRARYLDFSSVRGRNEAAYLALAQARRFPSIQDHHATQNNWRLWRENAPLYDRLKEALHPLVRRLLRRRQWTES